MNQENNAGDIIELTGTVVETLKGHRFIVALTDNSQHLVRCYVCGTLRRNCIKIMNGEQVKIEISAQDPFNGRIVFRINTKQNTQTHHNQDKNRRKRK